MPRLSVWFIRAAMLYLAAGVTSGGLILFHKGMSLHPLLWRLLPLHIEFLLFGWTVQLVMGVAFWIFPRFRRLRGDEWSVWVAFGCLNLGVWLAGVGLLLSALPLFIFLGRLLETGSVAAFVLHVWPRLKPSGAKLPAKAIKK